MKKKIAVGPARPPALLRIQLHMQQHPLPPQHRHYRDGQSANAESADSAQLVEGVHIVRRIHKGVHNLQTPSVNT